MMTAETEGEDSPSPLYVRWNMDLKKLAGMCASAEGKSTSQYVRDLIRDDAEKKNITLPEND